MKEKLEQLLNEWMSYHARLLAEFEVEEAAGVENCISDLVNLLDGGELDD